MYLSLWWRTRAKWYLFEEDNVTLLHPHHWELEESGTPPGRFFSRSHGLCYKREKKQKKIWELLNTELQF